MSTRFSAARRAALGPDGAQLPHRPNTHRAEGGRSMCELRNHTKLRADHLTRPALISIRQSTLMQVRENTASTARQ